MIFSTFQLVLSALNAETLCKDNLRFSKDILMYEDISSAVLCEFS